MSDELRPDYEMLERAYAFRGLTIEKLMAENAELRAKLEEASQPQEPDWRKLASDCYAGWAKGDDVVGPMSAVRAALDSAAPVAPKPEQDIDERAKFEKWAKEWHEDMDRCEDNHGYMVYSVHSAWRAWQARAALRGGKQ